MKTDSSIWTKSDIYVYEDVFLTKLKSFLLFSLSYAEIIERLITSFYWGTIFIVCHAKQSQSQLIIRKKESLKNQNKKLLMLLNESCQETPSDYFTGFIRHLNITKCGSSYFYTSSSS